MTNLEFSSFCKYAQQNSLASSLILKYNRAFGGGGGSSSAPIDKTMISPRGMSYGPPMNQPISSGSTMYNRYLTAITGQESGGKMNAINKSSGAMGLYQFMPKTLRGLGYQGSFQDFLKNPQLQTQYMHKFTQQNAKSLGIDINKMTIQQASLLAAAHYGGVGGARKIMSGNTGYGNTNYGGKTPYGYMTDIRNKILNYKPIKPYYK